MTSFSLVYFLKDKQTIHNTIPLWLLCAAIHTDWQSTVVLKVAASLNLRSDGSRLSSTHTLLPETFGCVLNRPFLTCMRTGSVKGSEVALTRFWCVCRCASAADLLGVGVLELQLVRRVHPEWPREGASGWVCWSVEKEAAAAGLSHRMRQCDWSHGEDMTRATLTKLLILVVLVFILCLPEFFILSQGGSWEQSQIEVHLVGFCVSLLGCHHVEHEHRSSNYNALLFLRNFNGRLVNHKMHSTTFNSIQDNCSVFCCLRMFHITSLLLQASGLYGSASCVFDSQIWTRGRIYC